MNRQYANAAGIVSYSVAMIDGDARRVTVMKWCGDGS